MRSATDILLVVLCSIHVRCNKLNRSRNIM